MLKAPKMRVHEIQRHLDGVKSKAVFLGDLQTSSNEPEGLYDL